MNKLLYILLLIPALAVGQNKLMTIDGKILTYGGKILVMPEVEPPWEFSPPVSSGLQLSSFCQWEDMTTAIPGDTLLTQWDDLSGNNNNLVQASTPNQPKWKGSSINGYPAALLDGDNDNMAFSPIALPAMTIFIVLKQNVIEDGFILRDGTANDWWRINHSATNKLHMRSTTDGGKEAESNAALTSTSDPMIITYGIAAAGTCSFYQNETDLGLKAGSVAIADISLRSIGHIALSFNGWIGCVLVYNRLLDAGEITSTVQYLNGIYSIY